MKNAMIWGAGGDIGKALLRELVLEGWTTVAVGREVDELDGISPHVFEADVGDPRLIERVIYSVAQDVEAIDLWIYAVGDILHRGVDEMTVPEWERILVANLTGAFIATHFCMPLLAEDACLVYLGAVSERLRLPGLAAYAAAKVGLEAFAEVLRKEERKRRILVVRPVAVVTKLWKKVPLRLPADATSPERVAQRILEAYRNGEKGTLDLVHAKT